MDQLGAAMAYSEMWDGRCGGLLLSDVVANYWRCGDYLASWWHIGEMWWLVVEDVVACC